MIKTDTKSFLPEPDPSGESYALFKNRGSPTERTGRHVLVQYRLKHRISAKEHFGKVWKPYVEAKLLFVDDLRRLDPQLLAGLYLQVHRDRGKGFIWKVSDILPSRRTEISNIQESLEPT